MAKLPPKRRLPSKRTLGGRNVSALPANQVQPGAVAGVASGGLAPTAAELQVTVEGEQDAAGFYRDREEFLALARARFRMSRDNEAQLRKDMLDDLKFYDSDQWPVQTKMDRTLDGRPTLTINRLPQFVRQVLNQARQSKPAIQINPVDNGADPDTAEVIQGITRNIERQSRAHIAYSTANEHQAIMGRGFWRILAEYAADDSMEQEIRIKRIMDQFTVYPDPACNEPDYSDATFCFIVERIPKREYILKYGEYAANSLYEFQSIGDTAPDWCFTDGVQVAEYFYIESVPAVLVDALVNDSVRITVYEEQLDRELLATGKIRILKKRNTMRRQVKWALINGVQVLDGNAGSGKDFIDQNTRGRDLPGPYIPVVPVLGEELVVDGRKNLRGMVRDAKDPQRAYNFWVSAETEMIALAPRAPVIGAVGQFEGLEEKWNQANRRNYPFLEYNPMDVNGHLVPPPARPGYDPNIGPIVEATMQADRDLKSVIGMFDASQEQSREQSGKAIIARQKQGEEGTSHFLDNLSRSIEHTGRILLHWIPIYYDKPRMLRIIGLDDQPKQVVVHAGQEGAAADLHADQSTQDPKVAAILEGRIFDVGIGRYDVTISVGPSYQSRRQESVEAIIQLVQAYPALLPVVGDILVGNMDWPGAKQLAERLKRMVPPEAKDPEDGQEPIPPEVQQQLQQLQQQLEASLSALAEKDDLIRTKQQELTAKNQIQAMQIQSNERLEAMRYQHEVLMAQVNLKNEMAMAMLEARLADLAAAIGAQRDEEQANQQFGRDDAAADKQTGRQLVMDERTRQHQTELARMKTTADSKKKKTGGGDARA